MQEKTRLIALVDFVQQSARLRAKAVSSIQQHGQFVLHENDLRGLPGVRLAISDAESGDEIWLTVQRLHERKPPEVVSPILQPWIQVSQGPSEEPKLLSSTDGKSLIAAGTHRSIKDNSKGTENDLKPAIDPDVAVMFVDYDEAAQVTAQFTSYVQTKWRPWSADESIRRKSIRLYSQLFTLKQQLEGAIVEAPLELAWGVGIGLWKTEGVTVNYPIVTRLVELILNPVNAQIEIRPRDLDPRLEIDWYASVDNSGVPDLEKAAKDFFRGSANTFSPFDRGTFEPLLQSAVSNLDGNGIYWPTETDEADRALPKIEDHLRVTDTWVLFARPRTQSIFLQDLERLKSAVEELDNNADIPGAVTAVVTDPSNANPVVELPEFRGVSASYDGTDASASKSKTAGDLYFPKPFNEEQVRIIQLLEVSDGVVVQGPPGTGKTHTIANVICHYLAQGKRVLVTSMKDPALAVLQDQLPEEIRPLAISLLSSEQAGMKQFEHAIQKIAAEVQVLDRSATARAITQLDDTISALHGKLAAIDRRVGSWAQKNLTKIDLDTEEISPQDAAREIADHLGQFEWLPDLLGSGEEFSPRTSDTDMITLREARRALGSDLEYLGAELPQLIELPDATELVRLHRDLSQFEVLKASVEKGDVPALEDSSDRAFEEAGHLAETFFAYRALSNLITSSNAAWTTSIRERLREGGADIFQMLDALGDDLSNTVELRKAFLRRPVIAPAGLELDQEIADAVANLAKGKRPFGFSGVFGKSGKKALIDSIRIIDRAPADAGDWAHVNDYFALQRNLRTLAIRWNALAVEIALPTVDSTAAEGGLSANEYFSTYLKVKKLNVLEQDILEKTRRLLPAWSGRPTRLQELDVTALDGILQHHLARHRLATVGISRERLRTALDDKHGPVVENMRLFLASSLGNPSVSEIQMQRDWSALAAELSRVLSIRGLLKTVQQITDKIESASAPLYAARLRSPLTGEVDSLIPDNWRKAWRLRRLSTYLEGIDPNQELKTLANSRREVETYLSRSYRDVVVKRTWLKLAENASPSIRAALQSYLAAIQKIGKGTGKRAVRFRQDARVAASQANPAVPCWIMPHYRVSESLPPELGCFNLVVIDEASQSDLTALPSLLRAQKVLIVGDDKQVSPEGVGLEEEKVRSLMSRFLGDQVPTFRPQMDPSRSIYDLFKVVFASSAVMLKEHFRCVSPIIEYSKREFYSHELRPLRLPKRSERLDPPLIDVLVEDGYRKGDLNTPEARVIVAEIKKLIADPAMAKRTIGVVSLLGEKQALSIWQRLSDEVGPEAVGRHKIACGDARTFQGKERDIVFLSMVSAPNDVGAPLSRDTFAQRFNVAASRARDRMYLVRSVTIENLSAADKLRRSLISHFAAPFSQDEAAVENLRTLCESPFETEVYDLLVDRGYRVTPQVKVGQYRIDMVVEGNNDARLAIECDGDKYHGADKWSDDMQRQRDLERAGWSFWRCFASTFLRRRAEIVSDLIKTLTDHGIEPVGIEDGPRSIHTEQRIVNASQIDVDDQPATFEEADDASGDIEEALRNIGADLFKAELPRTAKDKRSGETNVSSPKRPADASKTNVASDMADVLSYCRENNLRTLDNRQKSGAFWVFHTEGQGSVANRLSLMGMRYAESKGWWLK